MYAALLHHPERERFDATTVRLCVSGGAALPLELLRGLERTFGCVILEGYGLSETSPVACFNHPDRERKPGSIGTPIEGVEMKLVGEDRQDLAAGEVGEIAIRGRTSHCAPAPVITPTVGSTRVTWRGSTRTVASSSSIA